MKLNYVFRNTQSENFFATISKSDIEDPNIKYIFPLNWDRDKCYKIDRERLKSLIDSGNINYIDSKRTGGDPYIREKSYKLYFTIIPTKKANELIKAI